MGHRSVQWSIDDESVTDSALIGDVPRPRQETVEPAPTADWTQQPQLSGGDQMHWPRRSRKRSERTSSSQSVNISMRPHGPLPTVSRTVISMTLYESSDFTSARRDHSSSPVTPLGVARTR